MMVMTRKRREREGRRGIEIEIEIEIGNFDVWGRISGAWGCKRRFEKAIGESETIINLKNSTWQPMKRRKRVVNGFDFDFFSFEEGFGVCQLSTEEGKRSG